MTVVLVHVKRRKFFEGCKRKLSPVRHQTCIVPSRNHDPSTELLRFLRDVCPNLRQTGQFLYHTILVALHYIKQGFMFPDHFFIFCNYNAMALHACVHAVRPTCLNTPSNYHRWNALAHKYTTMILQTVMVSRCLYM